MHASLLLPALAQVHAGFGASCIRYAACFRMDGGHGVHILTVVLVLCEECRDSGVADAVEHLLHLAITFTVELQVVHA